MSKIWSETLLNAPESTDEVEEGEGVLAAAPPPLGHVGEIETSLVPSMDDDPADLILRTILYPDWDEKETVVISGPLGMNRLKDTGRRFKTAAAAEKWVNEFHGGYLQYIKEAEKGGRWAFRIKRPVVQ